MEVLLLGIEYSTRVLAGGWKCSIITLLYSWLHVCLALQRRLNT